MPDTIPFNDRERGSPYIPDEPSVELVLTYLENMANGTIGDWASAIDPVTGLDLLEEVTIDAFYFIRRGQDAAGA